MISVKRDETFWPQCRITYFHPLDELFFFMRGAGVQKYSCAKRMRRHSSVTQKFSGSVVFSNAYCEFFFVGLILILLSYIVLSNEADFKPMFGKILFLVNLYTLYHIRIVYVNKCNTG